MKKKFNITGLCNPQLHYMADISEKIDKIMLLVEGAEYFTINRPHQYGKTTVQTLLANRINQLEDFIALDISFEAIDYEIYQSKPLFIDAFLRRLIEGFENYSYTELSEFVSTEINKMNSFDILSSFIGKIVQKTQKKLVLIIDEVDKSSNNQLFLDFLATLRDRFLKRNKNLNFPTFHSVVLAGVHDVKKIKLKINPETQFKYNSPWNIAVDFTIDLSLNSKEIASMLEVYSTEKSIEMDIPQISERLHYYTSGYPFLTSYLCKIVDEDFLPERENKNWQISDIDEAFRKIIKRSNTNFEHLIKNLENSSDLYALVFNLVVGSESVSDNEFNPILDMGKTFGIFDKNVNRIKIHNRIYEHIIFDYMISKTETSTSFPTYDGKYIKNNVLEMRNLLLGFQTFMHENYSEKNTHFLEKHGTLLFLAFTKPVINGKGFDFKEVQVSEERRLDVVITYLNQKYIVELKRWRGEEAHQEGLEQLSDYLDRQNLKQGFLLIYDFRLKEKEYKHQEIKHKDKDIFAVWV